MKKLSIYTLLGGLLLATSCQKDLINPKSTTALDDEAIIQTKARIVAQENGLYSTLKHGDFYGERYQIYNEVRGEEFINNQQNSFTAYQSWNFTVINNSQEVQNFWSQAYKVINNANLFIDALAGKGGKLVDDGVNQNYHGEALFVRGISYYSLLQLYAQPYANAPNDHPGVIIYTEGHTAVSSYQKARATVTQSYAQAISDLDSAELLLPDTWGDNTINTTHANKSSAVALKTRVYLSEGNWAKVIEEANKIVSVDAPFISPGTIKYALAPGIADIFKTYVTTEAIFSLPFTTASSDAPGTQNSFAEYYLPGELGGKNEYNLNPAGIIAAPTWNAGDSRRAFIYTATNGKPYLTKFPTKSPYNDWAPVIRYAEVLLNLAEALTRESNTVDARAVALLSAVRNRSDKTVSYTTADFATATDLVNAILLERRIELLGEGLRGTDITRQRIQFPAKSNVKAVLPSELKYIWPISSAELTLNKLAVDNLNP